MKTEALFLFLIILLGLILCSFLGGKYNKEGMTSHSNIMYAKFTTSTPGTTFFVRASNYVPPPSGTIGEVEVPASDAYYYLLLYIGDGTTINFYSSPQSAATASNLTNTTFYPTNPPSQYQNSTATVSYNNNMYSITLTSSDGTTTVYNQPSNMTITPVTSSSTDTSNNNISPTQSTSIYNNTSSSSFPSYDNYNHYSGSSAILSPGTTFYSANGGNLIVNSDTNGTLNLAINFNGTSKSPIFYVNSSENPNTFIGPSGGSATITSNNGQITIQVQNSYGSYTFTQMQPSTSSTTNTSNPNSVTSSQYYGSTGSPIQSSSYNLAYQPYGSNNNPYYGTSSSQYYGPYGGSAGAVTGPQGNTAYYAQGPYGNTVAGVSSPSGYGNQYSSSLPPGIPASQIPYGQEDMYILKSEIVPPVCPACPASSACPREKECPPCEPCGRCPEQPFECKKVPNYNAINNEYLPQPVLNSFSQFGM
jgi:hypothetical protein